MINVDFIAEEEGFSSSPYRCSGGVWTIGYGSTIYEDGRKVQPTDEKITTTRGKQIMEWHLSNNIKLPTGEFTDDQKTALYSLIYNIGQRAFDNSNLKKYIETQDWAGVFRNWDWISAGGKPLKGLIKRRARELSLFIEDIK